MSLKMKLVNNEPLKMSVNSAGAAIIPTASENVLGGIKVGANLKIEDGVLSVDTAAAVEQDNTRPVTSAAVRLYRGSCGIMKLHFEEETHGQTNDIRGNPVTV